MTGGAARSAEPVKLRVGWVSIGADSPFLAFGKKGLAVHEGISYTLEAQRFPGTPTIITALAAGELDLASLSYSTVPIAIQNANMSDLRIIADEMEDGIEGYHTHPFMVLKESPIQTVEDLKGHVAAINAIGSATDIALLAMLHKHNLSEKKDVTIVEIGFPNMRAVLADHKVDLIQAVLPFWADPQLQSIARPLFTVRDAMGPAQALILTARQSFLEKNRAVVVDYLEDSLRALRWFTDPANHDEAVKLVAAFAKEPPERFSSWLFTRDDLYHDPNGLPNLDALQANIDLERQLGFIKAGLDVKRYVDLSYVKDAAARLH